MRTLITGVNGFLASALAVHCRTSGLVIGLARDENYKSKPEYQDGLTILHGDINNLETLKRIISDHEIELVYHCAAQSIVRIANTNPLYCFQNNIIGTANVLEAVRQINPKIKVVCASSDKAYGEHTHLPYLETMALQSGDPYSTSKACGDLVAQCYATSYNLNVNIVRSANIYGPGDMNLSRIIPNTINRILQEKKPQVYSGVMDFKREFVYVDDVCRAYQTIAEKGTPGEAYNVGTGEVFQVGNLITIICELMHWEDGIEIINKSFMEITTQYLSNKKLKKLGWKSEVSIYEGLQKTIDYYYNHAGRNL